MICFFENLLKLPHISVQNIIQEKQEIFLILMCTDEKVALAFGQL